MQAVRSEVTRCFITQIPQGCSNTVRKGKVVHPWPVWPAESETLLTKSRSVWLSPAHEAQRLFTIYWLQELPVPLDTHDGSFLWNMPEDLVKPEGIAVSFLRFVWFTFPPNIIYKILCDSLNNRFRVIPHSVNNVNLSIIIMFSGFTLCSLCCTLLKFSVRSC